MRQYKLCIQNDNNNNNKNNNIIIIIKWINKKKRDAIFIFSERERREGKIIYF